MKGSVTLKDLAFILNKSPSTISKALRGARDISEDTKKRVQETAEAFGYIPNHCAQSLKSRSTRTIGVIVPNVLTNFFAQAIHGIEKEATKHDFKVVVKFSNNQKQLENEHLLGLVRHGVDGILISFSNETQSTNDYDAVKRIRPYNIPVVMFDRINTDLTFDSITIDDFEASYKATNYLIHSNCKRVAFVANDYSSNIKLIRKQGYEKAFNKNKSNYKPVFFNLKEKATHDLKCIYFIKKHAIDGIVAADEISALKMLQLVQENGFKVPDDISIIGFNDSRMAEFSTPSLSMVTQYPLEIGEKSFKLLWRRLVSEKSTSKKLVITSDLILRNSTKVVHDFRM